MIQTPKYWLAPALVALAAWSRDERDLCAKAIDVAYSRDRTKTALFFALVLRRQRRMAEASRWLHHYFVGLDPTNLPRDFAVILEASAKNGFGAEGRSVVSGQVAQWIAYFREDPAKVAEQVSLWVTEVSNHRQTLNPSEFKVLRQVSPTWPRVRAQLESASALAVVEEEYRALLNTKAEMSATLEDQMDDLLEQLVGDYDAEELPLRREVAEREAVIKFHGDEDRVREKMTADQKAYEETIDALTMQSYTAMAPELLGVSTQTQVVSIGASKNDFRQAIQDYCRVYRAGAVNQVDLRLDGQHSNFAQKFGFEGWRASSGLQQAVAEQQIVAAWQTTAAKALEKVRFKSSQAAWPIIIALAVTLLSFAGGASVGLVVLFVAGGVAAAYIFNKKNKADKEAATLQHQIGEATAYSIDLYRKALAEWVDARLVYEDADAHERALLDIVDSWPTATYEGVDAR
jgi:hypothetical protein